MTPPVPPVTTTLSLSQLSVYTEVVLVASWKRRVDISSGNFVVIGDTGGCVDGRRVYVGFNYLHVSFVYFLMDSWWRQQMETFSALLAICAWNSPVPDEFPAQRPVTRSFDVFFDLLPNKRLSK